MRFVVRPSGPLRGTVRVPGDKSIAHRWLILAATARGPSELAGLPQADDVRSTAACLLRLTREQPGIEAWLRGEPDAVRIEGLGFEGLRAPDWPLDCGNSGTTMRLLAGLLAGRPFACALEGDESLSARPMERVAEPLRTMGAEVHTEDGHAPVQVLGGDLRGIDYVLSVPSAQVKGAVLLAGLQAGGETLVDESAYWDALRAFGGDPDPPLRDHTERALNALGAPIDVRGGRISVRAFQHDGFKATVPGDISSAAYLLAGAAIVEGSEIEIREVGLNPSRWGYLRLLYETEARTLTQELGEDVGRLLRDEHLARGSPMRVPSAELPLVVDEVPALAAVACYLDGESRFEGAGELRVKESDRLGGLVEGIRGLGGEADVEGDDLVVGGGGLKGGQADARGDHRLAIAFTIAALGAERESVIWGAEWASVSYPGFGDALRSLGADVEEVW